MNKTPVPRPPRWADKLLAWYCAPHLLEEVQGDLHEEFDYQVQQVGLRRARLDYVRNVLGFARPFAIKRKSSQYSSFSSLHPAMLRNYLTITSRSLWKNKGYAFLNIAGLAVGMACSFMIMLWVWDELSYNAFHQHYDHLYQVGRNWESDEGIANSFSTPYPLAGNLAADFPQIRYACRVNKVNTKLLTVGDKKIYRKVHLVDSVFLEMFSFPMLQGSPETALDEPKSIVLSHRTAKMLFNDQNPIGRFVRYNNEVDLQVTGVVDDPPGNSTFQFDFLVPYNLNPVLDNWYKTLESNWGNNVVQTFVQLHKEASEAQLAGQMGRFLFTRSKDESKVRLFLHPMAKWRLYDKFENGKAAGGLIGYVRVFSWTAGFILLIACINFMNLATARSQSRAREVGIRKVIGSTQRSLVWQFLGESNLLALLALLLSVLLTTLLLPWFNLLTDKQLMLSFRNPVYWLIGLGVSIAAGLLAGMYPAFYLSSFQPMRVLKGTLQASKSAALPRKILVTLQFTLSITLIISVIVINQQLQHTQNRSVGYDRNNLVMADYNDELVKNYEVLRRELLNSGFVLSVGRTQAPITEIRNFNEVGWRPARTGGMVTVNADHDYLPTFNVRLKRGRGFSRDLINDSSAVLLNESATKMMGLDDPLGEEVVFWGKTYHVIGVIEDMLMGSPYEAIEPAGVFYTATSLRKINIRFRQGVNLQAALAKTAEIFGKYSPSYPFDYQFVDDEYSKKFASEVRVSYLADTFAGLAIFISCLGLFGLATYTAQTRTREIGIRKVLGANIPGIVVMLSREYVLLIGFSLLVSSPLAWYCLDNWLQNYPYRIQISGWVFAFAGASALGIALLTISFQSVKAALMNPVKSLRNE